MRFPRNRPPAEPHPCQSIKNPLTQMAERGMAKINEQWLPPVPRHDQDPKIMKQFVILSAE